MLSGLTFLTLLWSPNVGAVTGGIQAAIFPHGLEYLSSIVSGTEIEIYESEVATEYDCYDELGIRDFNLNIPVNDLQISLYNDEVKIRVEFGNIYGDDMIAYGEDEDWLDICGEFETDILYLRVTNAIFEISLLPKVVNGDLEVEVIGNPSFTGELDMDVSWVPDDLLLYFLEETIFETIAETSKTMASDLLSEYWSASLLSGQIDDFDVSVGLTESHTSSKSISIGGDMDVHWVGDPSCTTANHSGTVGREPEISFGDGSGASLGLGATESQINSMFIALWEEGYLCFTEDRMELLWSSVEGLFDPNVAGITASAVFLSPPIVEINPDESTVSLSGLEVLIGGVVEGSNVELAYADLSATAQMSLALDNSITSLTLNLHELNLEVEELRADHLLSGQEGANQDLVAFLEGWLSVWAASELDNIVLFTTQFHTYGTYIRVQDVTWGDGEVKTLIKLYDEDDPEVDKVPPDTTVSLVSISKAPSIATFEVTATDDRNGTLAVSWSLDEQTWSSWSVTETIEIADAADGDHTLLVKSRDSWLNEDPSPSSISFEITSLADTVETKNCGCSASPNQKRTGLIWGFVVTLAALIRRKG